MEEEDVASESFDLSRLKVHSRNWILGRSTSIEASSGLKFNNPETEQVVSKILKYVEDKEKAHSILPERGTSLALSWKTPSTQAAPGS
jgi:hypothetical protein